MAKTLLKVGQTLVLNFVPNTHQKQFYKHQDTESVAGYLTHPKVEVIRIGANRVGCGASVWWVQVRQVNSPTNVGWIRYDTGAIKARIGALVVA